MDIYIINQEFNRAKTFQIMVKRKNAFYHIYQSTCIENGFNVLKIGNIWQCA